MKTQAAVLYEMGRPAPYRESRPLSVEEVDLEGPGPGEVLVEIAAAGLCHSDLSVIDGSRPRPMPMVLGHEAAGIVREVGPGVHDLKPGDPVVFSFVPMCGRCLYCAIGRPVLCENGNRANIAGTLLSGARRFRNAAGYPFIHPIIAVDIRPEKLELARKAGATYGVNAQETDPVAVIRDLTGGGAHYTFESVGNERVLIQAYQATRRGGTTVTIGLPHPERLFSVPAVSIVGEERTIQGA